MIPSRSRPPTPDEVFMSANPMHTNSKKTKSEKGGSSRSSPDTEKPIVSRSIQNSVMVNSEDEDISHSIHYENEKMINLNKKYNDVKKERSLTLMTMDNEKRKFKLATKKLCECKIDIESLNVNLSNERAKYELLEVEYREIQGKSIHVNEMSKQLKMNLDICINENKANEISLEQESIDLKSKSPSPSPPIPLISTSPLNRNSPRDFIPPKSPAKQSSGSDILFSDSKHPNTDSPGAPSKPESPRTTRMRIFSGGYVDTDNPLVDLDGPATDTNPASILIDHGSSKGTPEHTSSPRNLFTPSRVVGLHSVSLSQQSRRSQNEDINSVEITFQDLCDTDYCTPNIVLNCDRNGKKEKRLSEGSQALKRHLVSDSKVLNGSYTDCSADLSSPCDDDDFHTPKEILVDPSMYSPTDFIPENLELDSYS